MGEFRMPSLGADMDAGTVVHWEVAPGAHVHRGDVVLLVETQKGIIEVEIWQDGVIERILVGEGEKVPVGAVLATLADSVEAARTAAPSRDDHAPLPPPPPNAPSGAQASGNGAAKRPIAAAPPSEREHGGDDVGPERTADVGGPPVRATPAARQLARARGLDVSSIRGSGPHGAVTRRDVEIAPEAESISSAPPRTVDAASLQRPAPPAATGMRQAIAAAMSRSKREIPHYYLGLDVDVSSALAWLTRANEQRPIGQRLLFAAVLAKATARALSAAPELNGFFVQGAFRPSKSIHLGVAIALRQGGLVAPAIHDADRKSVDELMAGLRDLTARVRAGSLRSSEMSDPTVTMTSLGDRGTDSVFGVIYPPQVALVGFGSPRERPWAHGGLLGVRTVVTASLAADHRVSDGHRGARFLAALGRLLNEPEKL